ncbi:MAG TPA: hypothetical protein VGJ04_07610, partial [Pirellulales bacterium]
MNTFWELMASNALVATAFAIGTAIVSRFWKNSAAIHLLWVAVLVKLFTPPVMSVPLAVNWLSPGVHSEVDATDLPAAGADGFQATDASTAVNRLEAEFAGGA